MTTTNDMSIVNIAARDYFEAAGVNLLAPKMLYFNDRTGILMVKATLEDLEIIQQAVEMLNYEPPQVNIEARFVEVSQEDVRALGFDWFLGNTLLGNGNTGLQGGTAPSFTGGVPTPGNPTGVFPNPAFPQGGNDSLITSGLRDQVGMAPIATVTGILTDPQFRVVIKALEQRTGVDLMFAPQITTLSGRQTQIKAVEIQTVVTGLQQGGAAGGAQNAPVTTGGVNQPGFAQVQFTVQPFEFGPVLDVIPYVSADGYTIQMTIIPTLTQFLGYDDAGEFTAQIQSSTGNTVGAPISSTTPLPKFRLRQVATSVNVWDGQTVVIGGLLSETVTKIKDKVPVVGDLPWIGRLFRSESQNNVKRNLLIFVTPTIIDPAGNSVHAEDEMPFAQQRLPLAQ
ncbi:MAG TPA: hypothetical protein DCY13_11160 [Verrucomicrobiales bacterium]|nr:hypothetical protein [Verrucomicrobiales bacterium]